MSNPEVWGKYGWGFLHAITKGYPVNPSYTDKQNMMNFVNALGVVLPCDKCKVNFKDHLSKRPLTDDILKTRDTFAKWMIDIHNDVNKSLGKRIYTYEEVMKPGINYRLPLIACMIILFLILYAVIVIKLQ